MSTDADAAELGEAMPLIASLMEASLTQTFAAQNAVEEGMRRQIAAMADAFCTFYDLVDQSAEVATTRRLESALDQYGWAREMYERDRTEENR